MTSVDERVFTDAELNPDPPMWPQCSDCQTPYVLRRCMSMSKGWIWVWQQDCKHDRRRPQPDAVMANAEGSVVEVAS